MHRHHLPIAAVLAVAAGCASAPPVAPPEVPASLFPPAGQTAFLEALASGVQIYECAPKPDQPAGYAWVFRSPEATLADRSGRILGKHYAGPTWESTDGSSVVGQAKASDAGADAAAVPWLLLVAKSTQGTGTFGATTFVQRVRTVGGIAPATSCTASNAKQLTRVPYTATYYFYRTAP